MEKDYADINIKDITFGELRWYVSRIDRLSLCMRETGYYENFIRMRDVPDTYNHYYVYGIGIIESEFYKIGPHKYAYATEGNREDLDFVTCMEIMLSKKPRSSHHCDRMGRPSESSPHQSS